MGEKLTDASNSLITGSDPVREVVQQVLHEVDVQAEYGQLRRAVAK
ncbi:hypothetical protein ACWEQG_13245 [Microbispora sp. NPDC004025]